MQDQEVYSCVNMAMNQIKRFKAQKQAIKDDKQEKLGKVNRDIQTLNNLFIKLERGEEISLNCFESIKAEPLGTIDLTMLNNLSIGFDNMKNELENLYGKLLKSHNTAEEAYKNKLKEKNLDIFHNVADVMIGFGF